MNPRVVFIVRSTFDAVRGGDTLQLLCTARELERLGISIDIRKATDAVDYRRYDLMHLFNLIRPADHLVHIAKAGLPYVVSTIYLDYSRFDTRGRSFPSRLIFRLAGKQGSEYLKNGYRALKGQDRLASTAYLLGHRASVMKILEGARMLLPNSESEYRRLLADFGIPKPFTVIPNGIDREVFGILPAVPRNENQVLCVGQVYGLKNQHRLIEATRHNGTRLIIIGKPPPNHHAYYEYCRKTAHRNVEFHDFMPQADLVQYYARSKVHALPSWFETTGLSSLEAGAMGCNLVVGTGGDTHDYFDGYASFCDAPDQRSVNAAVEEALNQPTRLDFREHILAGYTWAHAARKTRDAYLQILDHAG